MKRILLVVICLSQPMFGMWHGLKKWLKQETKQDQLICAEFGLQKSPQQSFEFNQLPQELQLMIIEQIADFGSVEQSINTLRSLARVDKQWRNYLTPEFISKLLAKKHNISEVLAYWYLKSTISKRIPSKQITELISENAPEFNRVYQQALYLDFNTRSPLSKQIVDQLRISRHQTKKQWFLPDGSYLSLNANPDISVFKYTPDRTRDNSFGNINYVITAAQIIPELTTGEQGSVTLRNLFGMVAKPTNYFTQLTSISAGANPLGFSYISTDLAVQNTGKIVILGVLENQFTLVRLYENGTLDENFGNNGLVVTRTVLKKELFKNAQSIDLRGDMAILPVYLTIDPTNDEILLKIGNTYQRYNADGRNGE
jgi:hypothetical protein